MDLKQSVSGTVYDRTDDGIIDRVTDDGVFSREQDVTDILKDCAESRAEDRFKGFRFAPTFRRVASIPAAVIDIYAARGIDLLNDEDALKRFLVDPDNAAFRCTNERL